METQSYFPPKFNATSPFTHSEIGEVVVSGSTAFSNNIKLRISHLPLFLGHLSPSQFSDAAHSTSPESLAGMLW